ncbi:MAG: amino acid adenylation domain-containing protein [bacterium]|nr:amino acid adenylation domain-containing protein [bacterium]
MGIEENVLLYSLKFIRQKEYWMKKFSGGMEKTEISFRRGNGGQPDRSHSPTEKQNMPISLPDALCQKVSKMSGPSGLAAYILLLTGLKIAIYKFTGNRDITIVSPINKMKISGDTINDTVLIRDTLKEEMTFKELLLQIRASVLDAYQNQDYPFDKLSQYILDEQREQTNGAVSSVSCALSSIHESQNIEKVNQKLGFSFSGNNGNIDGQISYDPGTYEEWDIENIYHRFISILTDGLEAVDRKISELSLLSEEEKKKVLIEFNRTRTEYPKDSTIALLFEEQALKTPDALAVVDLGRESQGESVQLTYNQLNKLAETLTLQLKEKGVVPGTIVGLQTERSAAMIIGLLGILKSGGVYLPLDPDYPGDRIDYMLKDCNANLLVREEEITDQSFSTGGDPVRTDSKTVPDRSKTVPDDSKTVPNLSKTVPTDSKTVPTFSKSVPGSSKTVPVYSKMVSIHSKTVPTDSKTVPTRSKTVPTHSKSLPTDPGPSNASSPAYIMYTSGSTGIPKGVMIEHQSVIRLVRNTNYLQINPRDRILATGPLSFDASTLEIWGSLLNGAALYLTHLDDIMSPVTLSRVLEQSGITIIWMTVGLFNQMADIDADLFKPLSTLLVGGDRLSPVHINKVRAACPLLRIINGYGPTENTTFTATYPVDRDFTTDIPIGKPIANTQVYILDKHFHPVPVGAVGELCIAGDGLARGYLNNPELTMERFIYKDFSHGRTRTNTDNHGGGLYKVYKTGDMARWLPDGNIDFLGRRDHQVKIRGFRIELGEIEHRLSAHQGVKEAAVLVSENGGTKELAAFLVENRCGSFSQAEAREYLGKSLPSYMIPSHFITLENMPLTPNGKIDKKALLKQLETAGPGNQSQVEYVAPSNEIEEKLVEVWQGISRKQTIGVNANFFETGGDSIKAIQIASRLYKHGLKLEIRDLFKHPVLKELAAFITKIERKPEQGVIQGSVELTPIQQWFVQNRFTDSHHFNHAVMLYRQARFREEFIEQAFSRVTQHHDALRMAIRFRENDVVQENKGIDGQAFHLEVFNFRETGEALEKKVEKEANRLQQGIHLETGPLVKLALFKTPRGDHLLIVIHHWVIDGVSWRILLEDFSTVYRQLDKGEAPALEDKTDSFQYWAKKQAHYATSANNHLRSELKYWKNILETNVEPLPKDTIPGREVRTNENLERVLFNLDPGQTRQLVEQTNHAYNTEINDLLLTALALAVHRWCGLEKIRVNLEGHGREEIIDNVNITRTIGWFTSQFPLLLDLTGDSGLSYCIRNIKETLRQVPNKGIGFGILKYLSPHSRELAAHETPEISFNYLGEFRYGEDDEKEGALFSTSKLSPGTGFSPQMEHLYTLDIGGILENRRLTLHISFNKYEFRSETIQRLVDLYKSALLEITRHCAAKTQPSLTPSDYGDRQLSLKELDAIYTLYPEDRVDNIYPLSPLQEGFLFHRLLDKDSNAYFVQNILHLEGSVNRTLLEKSIDTLVRRHDILRTSFVYKEIERSRQVVLKERDVRLLFRDLSAREEQETHILNYRRQDKKQGFDLTRDRLIRYALFKLSETSHVLIWSYHHILMDGWCMGILFKELFDSYRHFVNNEPINLEPVIPYKTYILWLEKQDKEVGFNYWKSILDGYEQPALLPGEDPKTRRLPGQEEYRYQQEQHKLVLDRQTTSGLNQLASGYHVTLNTLFRTAWAILLQRYNNINDVVFGAVVSGRSSEVKGIENMMGLFINAIPVRIITKENQFFEELVKDAQEQAVQSQSREYLPLAEIQGRSLLKGNLVNHIIVFENYPLDEELVNKAAQDVSGFRVERFDLDEHTNYDFDVIILPGEELTITFRYNIYMYEATGIERISNHFNRVINAIYTNEKIKVNQIDILTPVEKRQLLEEFNDTTNDYPRDKTLIDLFEQQADKTPDHIAGVRSLASISYRELKQRAGQLGHYLREQGVGPGTIIAVMMERSLEMIIGIYGILKAGGAYLPIDPGYPEERIDFMLKDSNVKGTLETVGANLVFTQQSGKSNDHLPHATSPAYIIYTSGSTGNPKGVIIEHRSIVNRLNWMQRQYPIGEGDVILQKTPFTFDVSVWELFWWGHTGASVYFLEPGGEKDPGAIIRAVERHRVTTMHFVPSMLSVFLEFVEGREDPHRLASLSNVFASGEALTPDHVERFNRVIPSHLPVRLHNLYGPTEAAVDVTYFACPQNETIDMIPIGKPIDNISLYILNADGLPQPTGIAGELYIGGIGLARGYLNRPELTAERFYKSFSGVQGAVFQKSPLVYKSGDLARWMPDGNIEYLGRTDHQVKIKGFRIELGEIEHRLSQHPHIGNSVVMANDVNGRKELAAYVVNDSDRGNLQQLDLKEYLGQTLPHYMVPAHFVEVPEIPLSPSGKIDRKALSQFQIAGSKRLLQNHPVPPRNETEEKLVQAWQEVFGRDSIGITDNFFQTGGDSIKAIQISSKLYKFGLKLELSDLFNHPTIETLSQRITRIERKPDQGEVTGKVSLSPMQQWFFDSRFSHGHHFNQSIMLCRQGRFDKLILEQAFSALVTHHDALRLVFQSQGDRVMQQNRGTGERMFHLETIAVEESGAQLEERIHRESSRVQAGIHLETGPLLKTALFKTNKEDYLLIAIHHLAVDGVSWRILLEDLATAYRQLEEGEKVRLPAKTDSFQYWANKQDRYVRDKTHVLSGESDYWKHILKTSATLSHDFPKDQEVTQRKREDSRTVTLDFSIEQTRRLLEQTNRAYHTEINDILLTALALAVKHWRGKETICVNLEGHGRENIMEDVDISRTIGWFTAQFPVILDVSPFDSLSYQVRYIKETLRKIPHKGIGYGMLRYLSEHGPELASHPYPQISFNYLGEFRLDWDDSIFTFSNLGQGEGVSPQSEQLYALDINGIVRDDALSFSFSYNREEYKKSTIQELADCYRSALLEIIHHCTSMQTALETPYDYGARELSLSELDHIYSLYENKQIHKIYALGPMQEGLLFHWRMDKKSNAYFQQVTFDLEGDVSKNTLEKSINMLIQRHDILRTSFVYEEIQQPVQVVLKERDINIIHHDLSAPSVSPGEKTSAIENYKQTDKEQGFDLTEGPLIRYALFTTAKNAHRLIWSFHHILLDGWCTDILNRELIACYRSLKTGEPAHLEPAVPYRTYIQWLESRDKTAGLDYWDHYLHGYEQRAGLPQENSPVLPPQSGEQENQYPYILETYDFTIETNTLSRLNQMASRRQVTLNTLFQTAWGLLLQRYNNTGDVVFGGVVSGRPAGIDGIENMMGLFINTIPVRITSQHDQTVNQLISDVQRRAVEGKNNEYLSLPEIQARSPLKSELLNHILVFENYPIHEGLQKNAIPNETGFDVTGADSYEQTNYDFNILVIPGTELTVRFGYNASVFKSEAVNSIATHFNRLIGEIVSNETIPVKEIDILSSREKHRLLNEFNDTAIDYPDEKTIISLFEEQVERTPGNIAVQGSGFVTGDGKYNGRSPDYNELNEDVLRFAVLLTEKGVEPGSTVAIMIERSIEMIVAIFGILKAGAAYLPIDPKYPQERIDFMLRDSGALVALGTGNALTEHRSNSRYQDHLPTFPPSSPSSLAYIIYTSGSTGRPKGVMLEHRAVVNRLNWMQRQYPLDANSVILQKTPFTFDVSVWELFWWSFVGASVYFLEPGGEKDPEAIVSAVEQYRVTTMHFVPSMLTIFLEYLENSGGLYRLESLQDIFASGEALTPNHVERFNRVFGSNPRLRLHNLYGPTEAAVDVTYFACPQNETIDIIPIGKPIDNITLYILNIYGTLQPVGIAGELCIGGTGLARGYLNNPGLTMERFIYKDFSHGRTRIITDNHGGGLYKVYKTGDLARWLVDGNIEFLGRIDHQVKIRGFRIELGEIQHHLEAYPGVRDAVVIAGASGDLAAFVVTGAGTGTEEDISGSVKEYLSRFLPEYMVPSQVVRLEELPLNASGKVDRRALSRLQVPGPGSTEEHVGPRNPVEETLVRIWQEVLGVGTIGIHDHFFDSGGHSLKAARVVSHIYKEFDILVELKSILANPTIEKQAAMIEAINLVNGPVNDPEPVNDNDSKNKRLVI